MLDAQTLRELAREKLGEGWQTTMTDTVATITGRTSAKERRAIYVSIHRKAQARNQITPLDEIAFLALLSSTAE